MGLKRRTALKIYMCVFENDVNMHGTQTILEFCLVIFRFENDVKYLKQWKLQNSCTANNQKVLSELRMM